MMIADYGVLNPVWPGGAGARLADDAAFVQAMLDVEAAWVRVQAAAGLCTAAQSAAVEAVADVGRYDLAELAALTPDGANALIPLLGMMRARLVDDGAPAGSGTALHRGATSQDIIDTATVLALREAAALLPGSCWQKAETLAALIQRFHHPVDDVRRLLWHAERTGAPLPRSTRQVFRIIAID